MKKLLIVLIIISSIRSQAQINITVGTNLSLAKNVEIANNDLKTVNKPGVDLGFFCSYDLERERRNSIKLGLELKRVEQWIYSDIMISNQKKFDYDAKNTIYKLSFPIRYRYLFNKKRGGRKQRIDLRVIGGCFFDYCITGKTKIYSSGDVDIKRTSYPFTSGSMDFKKQWNPFDCGLSFGLEGNNDVIGFGILLSQGIMKFDRKKYTNTNISVNLNIILQPKHKRYGLHKKYLFGF